MPSIGNWGTHALWSDGGQCLRVYHWHVLVVNAFSKEYMLLQDARKAKGRVKKVMRVVSEHKLVAEKKKKRFEDVSSHYKYNKPMLPPVSSHLNNATNPCYVPQVLMTNWSCFTLPILFSVLEFFYEYTIWSVRQPFLHVDHSTPFSSQKRRRKR